MNDSRNLSTGQGHIVLEACRMAKTCPDIEKMCGELRELTGRVEASFLLSRLDYMVKGGRCSAVMRMSWPATLNVSGQLITTSVAIMVRGPQATTSMKPQTI